MTEKHAIGRVRHELRRRLLTVTASERLTPHMLRITLTGDDLSGFISASYDDHIKIFLPADGGEPIWPAIIPGAPALPEGTLPSPMRDFTPRRYDPVANELVIDFAVHEAGPATEWAVSAVPGTKLGIGGPRGSFVVADDFDWYVLIGDETALPAIGRRLEELRSGARAFVIATVTGPEEEQALTSRADLDIRWLHRPLSQASDAAPVLKAAAELSLPQGDGYVWIAGETDVAKALRQHFVADRGINKAWVKAAGYWRHGSVGFHESHNDKE
jgi:NADPH-dependent ferric siderophore reductase